MTCGSSCGRAKQTLSIRDREVRRYGLSIQGTFQSSILDYSTLSMTFQITLITLAI